MAGNGKYTTYVPPAEPRYTRLGKLFKGSADIESPFAVHMESGDNASALAETVQRGITYLQPDVQEGDLGHFPQGVNLNFVGQIEGDITNPNIPEEVQWESASDPANGYFPDQISPGPNNYDDPFVRDVDPQIPTTDIKPNLIPGQTQGTRVPSQAAEQISRANVLGQFLTLGKNSNEEPGE